VTEGTTSSAKQKGSVQKCKKVRMKKSPKKPGRISAVGPEAVSRRQSPRKKKEKAELRGEKKEKSRSHLPPKKHVFLRKKARVPQLPQREALVSKGLLELPRPEKKKIRGARPIKPKRPSPATKQKPPVKKE